jgi:hypothetical protein
MGTRRNVENLVSVFDLNVSKNADLPKGATARVLFVFDKKTNTKRFVIVKTDMPRNRVSGILSWLETNIDVDDLAFGLKSNTLDVAWSQGTLRLHPPDSPRFPLPKASSSILTVCRRSEEKSTLHR